MNGTVSIKVLNERFFKRDRQSFLFLTVFFIADWNQCWRLKVTIFSYNFSESR